jgi:SAM-dependent methyltransferase
MNNVLDNLDYFCEWGGARWSNMVRTSLTDFTGTDLTGKRVLEIGFRYGRMSSLFALLGADVTGVELTDVHLKKAQAELEKWGVAHKVNFLTYDGNLDIFDDESFDIVFTKSVLVVIPELHSFLKTLNRKLAANGQVIFLENGQGSKVYHYLRRWKHRRWDYTKAHFLKQSDMAIFRKTFDIAAVQTSSLPPIYLILGSKRIESANVS